MGERGNEIGEGGRVRRREREGGRRKWGWRQGRGTIMSSEISVKTGVHVALFLCFCQLLSHVQCTSFVTCDDEFSHTLCTMTTQQTETKLIDNGLRLHVMVTCTCALLCHAQLTFALWSTTQLS